MFPILFFAGPVGIRTAGVVALAALFIGAWSAAHRLARRGLPRGLAYDAISPALLAGLLAARVAYALAFDPAWYFERPMELLAVWKGGFAEEGGFLGALAAAVWWCRRRGVSLWVFGDAVAPGVAWGLIHPTQVYEAFAALLLTVILLLAEPRARPGELLLVLTLGLGLERGVFDLLRGDAIWIAGWMTSGQLAAVVAGGVLVLALQRNARTVRGEGTR